MINTLKLFELQATCMLCYQVCPTNPRGWTALNTILPTCNCDQIKIILLTWFNYQYIVNNLNALF